MGLGAVSCGARAGRWRSIAAKLYVLVGLVVVLLSVLIAIAVHASDQMGFAGAGLYRGVQAVSQADQSETLWERARGLAARVPAELDLDKQHQFHSTFGESLTGIRAALAAQRRDDDPALSSLLKDVDASVTAAAKAAEEVFHLGESFAQEQAVIVLNGPFAAAEALMAANLGKLTSYQKDAADHDLALLNSARRSMGWMIGVAGVVAVVLVGTIGTMLARWISGRVHRLTDVMGRLADGELVTGIPCTDDPDEIGYMARAVEVFKENAIEAERLATEQADARAAKERRQAAMEQLTQDFGTSVCGVMAALGVSTETMVKAADAMSIAAIGAHRQATGTAERAGQSSQDLTSIASAIEQMTASVDEITRQVASAAQVARSASERAAANDGMMRDLADAASRIGEAIRLIDGIAAQTNLLALNATIEAARAGEAGKGFAVVAGEVKSLASQTAKATAEIDAHIVAVRGAAGAAIEAMRDVGLIVGRMDAVTTAISAAVEQQSVTAREITSNVHTVSLATNQAVHAMTEVVGAANEAGQVSSAVRDGVADIGREAAALRLEIDQFLIAVRDEGGQRRHHERLPGNGAPVTVRAPDLPASTVLLRDISHSGASVGGDWRLPAGQEIELDLPNNGGVISARVVRCGSGVLAVVFRQDPATAARVSRAIEAMVARAAAA